MKFFALISFQFLAFFSYGQSEIEPEKDSCFIYMPNILTMDCQAGDDYQLHIYSDCTMQEFQIKIYNRWAEVLYESSDIKGVWDASDEDEDTFIYVLCGTSITGQDFDFRGQILLLK